MFSKFLESSVTQFHARTAKNLAMVVNAGVFAWFLVAVALPLELSARSILPCVVLECASFAVYGTARHIQGLLGVPLSGVNAQEVKG